MDLSLARRSIVNDRHVGLVHAPAAAFIRPNEQGSLAVFGFGGLLSICVFLAGLPLVSIGIVAATTVASLALGSARGPRDPTTNVVRPEAIVSIEARETYRAILTAFGELERTIADAPRLRSTMKPVLERCADAVRLCGRIAVSANVLQRYLDANDRAGIAAEIDRLRAYAEAATDDRSVAVLSHAVAARCRQLAARDEIAAARERIHARLELAGAALGAFPAMIVKLEVLDDEQLLSAGQTVTDHLDVAAEELEVVEAALAELAA